MTTAPFEPGTDPAITPADPSSPDPVTPGEPDESDGPENGVPRDLSAHDLLKLASLQLVATPLRSLTAGHRSVALPTAGRIAETVLWPRLAIQT